MRKRIAQAIIAAALVSTLIVNPVFATPSIDDLQGNKAEAEGEVSSLQSELTQMLDTISSLEQDLTAKRNEIDQASIELEDAAYQQAKQYEAMKLRIKYLYEVGDTSLLEALLTAESFSDLINKAEYVQNVHTYDRNKLSEYIDTVQKVETMKTDLQEEAASMQQVQTDLESEKAALSAKIESKQTEIAQLDQSIQDAIAAQQAAEAEAARQLEEQQAALQAAQAELNNNTDTQANASGNGSNGNDTSTGTGNSNSNSSNNNNSNNNSSSGGSTGGNTGGGGSGSYVPPQGRDGYAVVAYARQFLGNPYVLGGTSLTNGADCSGFVQSVYAAFGVSLTRTTYTQMYDGVGIPFSEAKAGDLIVYDGHVGIYNGSGGLIHASSPSVGIIESASCTYRPIIAVRRVL